MFDELMKVHTVEELDNLSVRLLDNDTLRQLQEQMVAQDIAFSRSDYWPQDILAKRTASTVTVKKALADIDKEPAEKKILHLMQIISMTAPGAATGVTRFLKRVTFA